MLNTRTTKRLAAISGMILTLGLACGSQASLNPGSSFPDEFAGLGASDPNHLTLALKFVEYKDSAGQVVLSADEVKTVVHGINLLYQSCNLHFRVDSYLPVDPKEYGLHFNLTAMSEMDPT